MSKYVIPNLKNACRILRHIGENGFSSGVRDLSKVLGIPRTTAIRIVETLCDDGFLKKDDGALFLGDTFGELAKSAMPRDRLASIIEPHLARITKLTGETAHFVVFAGVKAFILRVCESSQPLHASSKTGTLIDMHCSGAGKMILAQIYRDNPEFLKKIKLERRTPKTITDADALAANLRKVLKDGYAIDDEEYHTGVRCMGVPVFNAMGGLVGAVGITAPAVRFTKKRDAEMFNILSEAASEISF